MLHIIETERMYLTEFSEADAENHYRLNSDPIVLQYTGDSAFDSHDAARTFLRAYDNYRRHGFGRWNCRRKSGDDFLGWCGLKRNDDGQVDLGFRFLRSEWNRGYATEAARACLAYGFGSLGLTHIIGRAHRQNHASIRVLTKVGMVSVREEDDLRYFTAASFQSQPKKV